MIKPATIMAAIPPKSNVIIPPPGLPIKNTMRLIKCKFNANDPK